MAFGFSEGTGNLLLVPKGQTPAPASPRPAAILECAIDDEPDLCNDMYNDAYELSVITRRRCA